MSQANHANNFIIDTLLPHFKISILQNVMYLPNRVGVILETVTIVFLWKVVGSTNNVCSLCSKWIFRVHAVHGLKRIDLPFGYTNQVSEISSVFTASLQGLSLSSISPVTLFSTPHTINRYFVDEFYRQQAISPLASRENQGYSAVTGVAGYGPQREPLMCYAFLVHIMSTYRYTVWDMLKVCTSNSCKLTCDQASLFLSQQEGTPDLQLLDYWSVAL